MPLISIAVLAAVLSAGSDEPPGPALTIRLVRPQVQGTRFLALFEGAPMPHPAAALAAYKRALMGNTGLSKAAEAGIAFFNPDMLAELATLDGASLRLSARPDGHVAWDAVIPRDDGTFSSLATAAALTDGAPMPALEGLPVDRLGPRAAASLAARAPGGFLLAGTRDDLADALRRSTKPSPPTIETGLMAGFDPKGLDAPGLPLDARRLGAAFNGLKCRRFDATLVLEGETLTATLTGRFTTPPVGRRQAIDHRWLDGVPAGSTLAAFAVALDPTPAAWDATFAILDRIEKADPTFAAVAPLRTRIDLLAAAAGVRTDADLLGVLVGLSGVATVDDAGQVDGLLIRLHARDEASAERLRAATVPRLAETARLVVVEEKGATRIGTGVDSIVVGRKGTSVSFAWGPAIAAKVAEAEARPEASERAWIARAPIDDRTQRFAAIWPGRLTRSSLSALPPTFWAGGFEGTTSVDRLDAPALKTVVRRMLEGVPFDPPPDAATPLPRHGG
jgi:hypothetical protein